MLLATFLSFTGLYHNSDLGQAINQKFISISNKIHKIIYTFITSICPVKKFLSVDLNLVSMKP